jgi:PAS domain S-box-containing protein
MVSKRWVWFLLAALGVELALDLVVRLGQLGNLMHRGSGLHSTIAVANAAWLLVPAIVAVGLARSLYVARRTLHRQNQVIAADASTSPDWLWESDTKHRFTYSSNGVKGLLGYDPEHVIGTSTLSLLAADQIEHAERLLEQSLTGRAGWDMVELTWRHADGSLVVMQGTAAAIHDEKGHIIGFRGIHRRVTDAMAAERALAGAKQRVGDVLAGNDLDVALQPIVDLSTGRLAGVEALARFRDGRGPEAWFRDASDTGQALELDRLAFTSALRVLPELPTSCYLSVNASPELLLEGALLRSLSEATVPLDRIVIEITEHVKITSYQDLHTSLAEMRERGVRLAIDDTGAGYASLNHVLQLRPDIIKMDRSLIANVTGDPARRSLVTALVLLALDLDATVVGEGIESPSELETLAALGVDCGQGYLLARPSTDRIRWRRWFGRNWLEARAALPERPQAVTGVSRLLE